MFYENLKQTVIFSSFWTLISSRISDKSLEKNDKTSDPKFDDNSTCPFMVQIMRQFWKCLYVKSFMEIHLTFG